MKRAQVAIAAVIVILIASLATYALSSDYGRSGSATAFSSTTSTVETTSTQLSSATASSSTVQASTSVSASGSSSVSTASTSSSSVGNSSSGGRIQHVIIIMMENEGYGQVIGNPSAPYENSLASEYAVASNYFAVSHPSLPNYLALVAGATFGIGSDCAPAQCSLPNSSIADLLVSHGLSWKEYAESMPANCSQTNSGDGLYATKHDPFIYFSPVTNNPGSGATSEYCDSHVVALPQFWSDLQGSGLPNYSFITPNLCDDAHSCPLSTGDAWLASVIPRIINSSYFSSTAIFVVYDEGSGSTPGSPSQVLCLLVSPFARPGLASTTPYTHYSLLATVESIFNIGNLGRNDANATVMSDLFTISV